MLRAMVAPSETATIMRLRRSQTEAWSSELASFASSKLDYCSPNLGTPGDSVSLENALEVTLTVDGRVDQLKALQAGIGNDHVHGAGVMVSDEPSLRDGPFDVYVVKPQSIW